jgi:hypothetical protein
VLVVFGNIEAFRIEAVLKNGRGWVREWKKEVGSERSFASRPLPVFNTLQ